MLAPTSSPVYYGIDAPADPAMGNLDIDIILGEILRRELLLDQGFFVHAVCVQTHPANELSILSHCVFLSVIRWCGD